MLDERNIHNSKFKGIGDKINVGCCQMAAKELEKIKKMYSVLFSRIEMKMNFVSDKLKQIIQKNSKVAIFPWTFLLK